jgi:hypothetical protein
MALRHSPKIVTDGLVLCLDAANTKSYPGTGTTWNDLSKNKLVFTTTTAPTFSGAYGGGFTFTNASHEYFQSTTNSPFSGNQFDITVTAVLSQNVLGNYLTVLGQNDNAGLSGMAFLSSNGKFGTDHWSPGGRRLTVAANQNQIYMVTWTIDSWEDHQTTTKIYLNGISQTTESYSVDTTGTLAADVLTIGNWDISRTDMDFDGELYFLSAYDRVLTDIEVLQNYNAMKSRFT